MTLEERLVEKAKKVAAKQGVSLATLGKRLCGDGTLFTRLRDGTGGCGIRRYQEVSADLDLALVNAGDTDSPPDAA